MVENSDARGEQVIIISSVFTGIAFIIVVLRLATRFIILRCQGLEDWMIMAALIGSIGYTILVVQQVQFGLGKHLETLSPHDVELNLKFLWGAIMVYYFSLGLIKVSVLLQYLRLFPAKTMRWTCYILTALVGVYTAVSVFIAGFDCNPVALFWDKTLAGHCINDKAFWFANATFNIVSDLAILVAPMPVLKSLNLGQSQKIAICGIFALGGFTVIVSILRLKSLYTISISSDPTFDNVGAATWSGLEINTALICSCLPVLRPLITRFFSRAFTNTVESGVGLRTVTQNRASRMPAHPYLPTSSFNADREFPARARHQMTGSEGSMAGGVLVTKGFTVQSVESTGDAKMAKGGTRSQSDDFDGSPDSSLRYLVMYEPEA